MRIGIVDTMFSRLPMGEFAISELKKFKDVKLIRRTVPGIKDLPVESLNLIKKEKCAIVLACGWIGKEPVDKICGHEASLGIQQAQLMTGKHILEAVVHEDECRNPKDLYQLAENRVRKHALNAYYLIKNPKWLERRAGMGERQGRPNAGRLRF